MESYQDSFRKNGYVVIKNHVTSDVSKLLSDVAIKTLFDFTFVSKDDKPEPNFENLKYFSVPAERKNLKHPLCIWIGGESNKPFCSRVTGSCYGSYLREVQKHFTMTVETFERLAECYETDNIGQIYGPRSYSIRMKGGLQTSTMLEANLISDYNNLVKEEKILSSLVVSIDRNVKLKHSGTWCVIPRFHLYKHHARIFFNFVRGQCRLPLDLSTPMQFPDNFLDEALPKFNTLLSQLYQIRDSVMEMQKEHEPYLNLKLPEKDFMDLKWDYIFAEVGDLVLRSQWLPYYETACTGNIPFIAFHVGYYVIPSGFLGTYKQRRLVEALYNGFTMKEHKEWEEARNNTCERDNRNRIGDRSPFFYAPDDDDELDFAFRIQCIDPEFLTTQIGMDLK